MNRYKEQVMNLIIFSNNMKKHFNKLTILSYLVFLPAITFAQGIIPSDAEIQANGFCAFAKLINTVIDTFLKASVSIAAITFAVAGARLLFHPNVPAEIEKAKSMFTKTVIGIFIVLGAWLVIHTAVNAIVDKDTGALRFLGEGSCPIGNK